MRRLTRACLSCASVWLLATSSSAQSSSADVATAQALFEDGKKAMQAGHYDEACPKLVESQRLDPGGGTLLAIALCHEGQGRTATAWGDFSLALEQARKDNRLERVKAAQTHLDALNARLARVRVVVASPSPPGLEVRRDGELVGSAQWGTPLPLDPGSHTYEARAPGKVTWTSTVPVPDAGGMLDVAIPALQDARPAAAPPAPPAPVPVVTPTPPVGPRLTPAPNPPPPAAAPFDWRAAGLITGAVGLVGIGVGGIFGLVAKSKWSDAQSLCPNDVCSRANAAAGLSDQSSAGSAADTSSALFIAGGAVLVVGAAMILFGPTDAAPPPSRTGIHVEPLVGRTNGLAIGGSL